MGRAAAAAGHLLVGLVISARVPRVSPPPPPIAWRRGQLSATDTIAVHNLQTRANRQRDARRPSELITIIDDDPSQLSIDIQFEAATLLIGRRFHRRPVRRALPFEGLARCRSFRSDSTLRVAPLEVVGALCRSSLGDGQHEPRGPQQVASAQALPVSQTAAVAYLSLCSSGDFRFRARKLFAPATSRRHFARRLNHLSGVRVALSAGSRPPFAVPSLSGDHRA